ncbi:MAG: hypothetical protein IT436_18475 [Phycisphaerales bacterium]|nr:hypothetical protein [Phycisphaerales bacterium]
MTIARTTRRILPAAALLITALAAGCGGHYKVTDPASGKAYYTTSVDHERNGAVKFKDARTDSKVTLMSSEVQKISKKDYKAAVEAK